MTGKGIHILMKESTTKQIFPLNVPFGNIYISVYIHIYNIAKNSFHSLTSAYNIYMYRRTAIVFASDIKNFPFMFSEKAFIFSLPLRHLSVATTDLPVATLHLLIKKMGFFHQKNGIFLVKKWDFFDKKMGFFYRQGGEWQRRDGEWQP